MLRPMLRLALLLALVVSLPAGASAQRIGRTPPLSGQPRQPNLPRSYSAPTFGNQVLAGMRGWVLGAVLGIAIGKGLDRDGGGGSVIAGAVLGPVIGTPVALHLYMRDFGISASPAATVGGTLVGVMGGPLMPVTMPLGATVGYNSSRFLR